MYPKNEQKLLYKEITEILNLTDGILNEVMNSKEGEKYLELTRGLIENLNLTANELSSAYASYIEKGFRADKNDKEKIEKSVRSLYQEAINLMNKIEYAYAN